MEEDTTKRKYRYLRTITCFMITIVAIGSALDNAAHRHSFAYVWLGLYVVACYFLKPSLRALSFLFFVAVVLCNFFVIFGDTLAARNSGGLATGLYWTAAGLCLFWLVQMVRAKIVQRKGLEASADFYRSPARRAGRRISLPLRLMILVPLALILAFGAVRASIEKFMDEALIRAINNHNTAQATTFLKRGANPNTIGTDEPSCDECEAFLFSESYLSPALEMAARRNEAAIVALLLDKGADSHTPKMQDYPLLHTAIFYHAHDVMRLLIARGANIEGKDESGNTPLMLALETNDDEAVKMLLAKGADIHAQDAYDNSVLSLAGQSNLELVTLILNQDRTLQEKARDATTCLFSAASGGDETIINYLFPFAVDIHAKDKEGRTALMLAKNAEIAGLFLKRGADINARDNNGETALKTACEYYGTEDTIKKIQLLVKSGADVNAGDNNRETPLMAAIASHQVEAVRLLLDKGAETLVENRENKTPREYAEEHKYDFASQYEEISEMLRKPRAKR